MDAKACELLLGRFSVWLGGCGVAAGRCDVVMVADAFRGAG